MKNLILVLYELSTINLNFGPVADRVNKYFNALLEDPEVNIWVINRFAQNEIDIDNPIVLRDRVYQLGSVPEGYKEPKFDRGFGYMVNIPKYLRQFELFRTAIEKIEGEKVVFVWQGPFAFLASILLFFRKKLGLRVYAEANELALGIVLNWFPRPRDVKPHIYYLRIIPQFISALLSDLILPFFSGLVFISSNLRRLFSWTGVHYTQVPILADDQPVLPRREDGTDCFNIGFAGAISRKKEGLGHFITALKWLKKDNINFKMNLYGYGRETEDILALCSKLGLDEHVIFHGEVPSSMIPDILAQQDLLVLTRPSNLQTECGFSTKLASYLISGVPVICTPVSDNAVFLKDGESAFIVPCGNAQAIYMKLKEIIGNIDKAREVGLNGRQVALQKFHWKQYSRPLIDLFFKIR